MPDLTLYLLCLPASVNVYLFILFQIQKPSKFIEPYRILLNKFLIFDQYEYIHCRILDFNRHMFGVICLQSQFFANEQ